MFSFVPITVPSQKFDGLDFLKSAFLCTLISPINSYRFIRCFWFFAFILILDNKYLAYYFIFGVLTLFILKKALPFQDPFDS